jgi:hypothetical protein
MTERETLLAEIAEKQARLSELDSDPLLAEAAAVCSAYFKAQDLTAWKEYLPDGRYAKDAKDPELNIALAALRGGMEIAKAETLEALRQIAGYSEVNGMTRIRMRKIAAAAIAKIEGEQP